MVIDKEGLIKALSINDNSIKINKINDKVDGDSNVDFCLDDLSMQKIINKTISDFIESNKIRNSNNEEFSQNIKTVYLTDSQTKIILEIGINNIIKEDLEKNDPAWREKRADHNKKISTTMGRIWNGIANLAEDRLGLKMRKKKEEQIYNAIKSSI
jgi:hypothetical protein